MKILERRALGEAEIRLGRIVFENEIRWDAVRIFQAPALGFGAMVPHGATIVFSKWRAARNFAEAKISEQAWLAHELAHVWQAARGRVLALAKLGALGSKAYVYAPKQGASLGDYNIESQAEIVRHLFLARLGRAEKGAPEQAWLEAVWSSR